MESGGPVHLSFVLPAYNEAERLPRTLERLRRFVAEAQFRCEVLLVENGSLDHTAAVATAAVADFPALRVIRLATAGKGRAVRAGMLEAKGTWRLMCDVDLAMPLSQVQRFLPQGDEWDIGIGVRVGKESLRSMPPVRRLAHRAFQAMSRRVVGLRVSDSQCGFKCFRNECAQRIFAQLSIVGYCFDIEMLCIAQALGCRVREVPIDWLHDAGSNVRPVKHGVQMARDLFLIRKNLRAGKYGATEQTSRG